jgi:hypothetical protein
MRYSFALPLSIAAVLLACADPEIDEPEAFRVFGPTTTNVDTVATGWEASVGFLQLQWDLPVPLNAICSAVAVSRNAVVTARHCVCGPIDLDQSTFCLPQGGTGDRCIGNTGNGGFTSSFTSISSHPQWADTCEHLDSGGLDDSSYTAVDLAVIHLADPIPVSLVPELPEVHLGNNPLWFAAQKSAELGAVPAFYLAGFGDTSWPTDPPNNQFGVRRRGQVGTDLHSLSTSWGLDLEGWGLASDANNDPAALASFAGGDSGGPIVMQPEIGGVPTGPAYVIGVASSSTEVAWDDDQIWAITGSRGQHRDGYGDAHNSDVVATALVPDVDGDQVLDDGDNCPPSACPNNAWMCDNPAQTDTDQDDVGDHCDRCDDHHDALGFGVPGPDGDGDGVGDVCDTCPLHDNAWQSDSDGDGVGDECDTCVDDPNGYATCTDDAGCGANGPCRKSNGAAEGLCSLQGDDADGDQLGAACDGCPANPNDGLYEIFTDSNADAQTHEGVSALGDVCDPVPQYIARPLKVKAEDANDACMVGNEQETCRNLLKLAGSATIGSTDGDTETHHAPVGFRHCDCYDANEQLLDRETCLATQCTYVPSDYTNPASPYRRMSIGVDGEAFPSYPASQSSSTLIQRLFTSIPNDGRIGPTETLVWPWLHDVEQGNIAGHPAADPVESRKTGGILWTTAARGDRTYASVRDESTDRQLRSVLQYVITPFVAPPEPIPAPSWEPALQCPTPNCFQWLRPGLERIYPPDYYLFDFHDHPMLLQEYAGAAMVSRGEGLAAFDATELATSEVIATVLSRDHHWLSPVEDDSTAHRLGTGAQGMFLPQHWLPDSEVFELGHVDGVLTEQELSREGMIAPSERSHYSAVFSAAEQAVYMAGGVGPWGDFLEEVWRFDLHTRTWNLLTIDGPGLQDVLEVGYAPEQQEMIVIDRDRRSGDDQVHIVAIDLAELRAERIATYEDAGVYDRVDITAGGDGTWVLVGNVAAGARFDAFRLDVREDGSLNWLGELGQSGQLLDGGVLTDAGVIVPTSADGRLTFPLLDASAIVGATEGPGSF